MGEAGTIKMGSDASWVAQDPSNGCLCVVNSGRVGVSIRSTATSISGFPASLAFFTVLIGVGMAMLVERRLGRQRGLA